VEERSGAVKSIVFDTESAGLRDEHPTIQLAAVAIEERTWEELGAFEVKIRFNEADADPEALKMNHYDPEVWKREAVPMKVACEKFAAFIEPHRSLQMVSKRTGRPYNVARLIGHNAATFDGPRLKLMYQQCGLFLPADPRVRCSVQMAMHYCDAREIQPPSYRLTELLKFFDIPVDENAHDALADTRMAVQLVRRLRDARVPEEVACA
jgi:DNA polymerase III epsilon subunit-like protein